MFYLFLLLCEAENGTLISEMKNKSLIFVYLVLLE